MVRTPGSYCVRSCINEEAQAGSHVRHLRISMRIFMALIVFMAICHAIRYKASPAHQLQSWEQPDHPAFDARFRQEAVSDV